MASILVVDDEADLLATYERVLRRQGHRVLRAGTRGQALEALRADTFALIIADIRLPDGDGLDVVRAAGDGRHRPPVIVVTGFPSEAGRQQALAAGATAYLGKPFSLASFTDLVTSLLARESPNGLHPV